MSSRVSVRCVWVVSELSFVASLVLSTGCGSGAEEGSSGPDAPAASAGAGPSSTPPPEAPSSPAPASPNPAPPRPEAQAVTPEASAPAGVEGVAASEACDALGMGDACGACVCTACRSELEACLGVPGCAEILACVAESGCSGRDCYCGESSLTECIGGEADGPCKGVVLAAPGGRAPSIEDPSGGPASDAALRLSDCAEGGDVCRDMCGVSD